jgi:hypothetical protein
MNSEYPQNWQFRTSKFHNINLTSEVRTVSFYMNWIFVFMTLSIVTGFCVIFAIVHHGWNKYVFRRFDCSPCPVDKIKLKTNVSTTGWALVFRQMNSESTPSVGSQSGDCATECTVRDSNPGRIKRFFSSPERPDLLWGPPSLMFRGYRGPFLELKRPGVWGWPPTSIWCRRWESSKLYL